MHMVDGIYVIEVRTNLIAVFGKKRDKLYYRLLFEVKITCTNLGENRTSILFLLQVWSPTHIFTSQTRILQFCGISIVIFILSETSFNANVLQYYCFMVSIVIHLSKLDSRVGSLEYNYLQIHLKKKLNNLSVQI